MCSRDAGSDQRHGRIRRQGVYLIALNQEEQEKPIGAFLISNGLKARVGLDRNASIARQFGVDAIPQTIIIDQQGLIAGHGTGDADPVTL